MRKFITNLTAVASLALAAIPIAGLASAAHAAEPSARISLVGLNLNNPAHAAEFADRIDAEADKLCRARARNNAQNHTFAGCLQSVRAEARDQLSKSQRQALRSASRATPMTVAAR